MIAARRKLAAMLTPLGGDCPPMRFFEPTPAFFEAMRPFYGLDIIDIGAGKGHVAVALAAHAHSVTAIDVRTDGAVFPVDEANAVTFDYPAGSVALFCRPCHSPFFVEPTIARAIECDVRAIIYAGLPRNVNNDLGMFRRRFRRAVSHVGGEGESFYLYDRREP
jgi:hypothetical protein